MKFILASASPRRKSLMNKIAQDFICVCADVDERQIESKILEKYRDQGRSMVDIAEEISINLSLEKALAVKEKMLCGGFDLSDAVIVGADTSVALSDEILGKPLDREDAVRMLRKESCDPQYVVTGVTLLSADNVKSFAEKTKVVFHQLDDAQERRIQKYCDTDEPYDKAGAYGIQLYADSFVESIEGDYDNIVGFPVRRILDELESF